MSGSPEAPTAEVFELCSRILGAGPSAAEAARAALAGSTDDRVELLGRAVEECRSHGGAGDLDATAARDATGDPDARGGRGEAGTSLADAVAAELAVATRALPQRQREALALRERFGLSYAELARVTGLDVPSVPWLIAHARLALRAELRSPAGPDGDCGERERAARALACRQDGEVQANDEDEWVRIHLSECAACERMHAAMLEASVCYRGWSGQA